MDKEKKGIELPPTIPVEDKVTIPPNEDMEAKVAALEAEKATILEREANYKMAYLKEKSKKEDFDDPDEKMRKIASDVLADSRLAEIAREQDAIIKKALKENKELKLAQLNKTDIPASIATSGEGVKVTDTTITPEQLNAFKARKWSDKDIERYKQNLKKYGAR